MSSSSANRKRESDSSMPAQGDRLLSAPIQNKQARSTGGVDVENTAIEKESASHPFDASDEELQQANTGTDGSTTLQARAAVVPQNKELAELECMKSLSPHLAYKVRRNKEGEIVGILAKEGQPNFVVGAINALNLLEEGNIALDRTCFTEYILSPGGPKCLAISTMKKSGTTMAFGFIELYAGTKCSEEEKKVERLLTEEWIGFKIMENQQLREEVFQQIPVIRVDFSTCGSITYDRALEDIRLALKYTYASHRPLVEKFRLMESRRAEVSNVQEDDAADVQKMLLERLRMAIIKPLLSHFDKILLPLHDPQNYSHTSQRSIVEAEDDIIHSVRNLCNLLYALTGKDPIVLFDEVEAPLHQLAKRPCLTDADEFQLQVHITCLKSVIEKIVAKTVSDGSHFRRALIMSNFPLSKSDCYSSFERITRAKHNSHAGSFHIAEETFRQLAKEMGVVSDDHLAHAVEMYNGIRLRSENSTSRALNTWSALSFLSNYARERSLALRSYWEAGSVIEDMAELFYHVPVAREICDLLWGDDGVIRIQPGDFTTRDINSLYQLRRSKLSCPGNGVNSVKKLLHHAGLFEYCEDGEQGVDGTIAAVITNSEARKILTDAMFSHYRDHDDYEWVQLGFKAAELLEKVYESADAVPQFQEAMEKLFTCYISPAHARDINEGTGTFLCNFVTALCPHARIPTAYRDVHTDGRKSGQADLVSLGVPRPRQRVLQRTGMVQEQKHLRLLPTSGIEGIKVDAVWQGASYSEVFFLEDPPLTEIIYLAVVFCSSHPPLVRVKQLTLSELLEEAFGKELLDREIGSERLAEHKFQLMGSLLTKFKEVKRLRKNEQLKEGDHRQVFKDAIDLIKYEWEKETRALEEGLDEMMDDFE